MENLVVVEVKCVEAVHPVHQAQLLSYLRLSRKNVGLLINFYVAHLKDGITRMVDGYSWELLTGRVSGLTAESGKKQPSGKKDLPCDPLCPLWLKPLT